MGMSPLLYPYESNPLVDILQRNAITQSGYEIGSSVLECLFDFMTQPGYQPSWIVRPHENALPFTGNYYYQDSFPLPTGSFILGFTFASSQAVGFKFSLFDVGSQSYIFNTLASAIALAGGGGATQQQPYWLPKPRAVLGTLNIDMTNLSPNSNDMQICIACAVPTDPASDVSPAKVDI
jgi:hypothetical protein